jgi:hypothetical protein
MHSARLVFGAALLAIVTAPGVSTTAGPADPTPTFNKDVAAILFNNCVTCHRPNQMAPMRMEGSARSATIGV